MNRAERRRQERDDRKRLQGGVNVLDRDIKTSAALARSLSKMLARAKQERNVDPPVEFLYANIEASLSFLRNVPTACSAGCSHCCHTWVSVSAPEALFVAKRIRALGTKAVASVREKHEQTKAFDLEVRHEHPVPCPLLKKDQCSIYKDRPSACRWAASADAQMCKLAFHYIDPSASIPTPAPFLMGRSAYAIARAAALVSQGLQYSVFEFNAAVLRALGRCDAEAAWLAGEDVFSDVMQEPSDPSVEPYIRMLVEHAF